MTTVKERRGGGGGGGGARTYIDDGERTSTSGDRRDCRSGSEGQATSASASREASPRLALPEFLTPRNLAADLVALGLLAATRIHMPTGPVDASEEAIVPKILGRALSGDVHGMECW